MPHSPKAYINQIATAVPAHDVHDKFVDYAPNLLSRPRDRALFRRMAERAGIEHRHCVFAPSIRADELDSEGFYKTKDYPGTKTRMRAYERHALPLALTAIDQLDMARRGPEITHVIVTSCTGFYAPGLDIQIVRHYGLSPSVERSIVGFMGCYAAMNALKLARHIVRSDADAGVLIVNLELCTLHLRDTDDLETILSYLIFADGCAASFVSAQPSGIELQSFHSTLLEDSAEEIRWHIGDEGFEMFLSGRVPACIAQQLPTQIDRIVGERDRESIAHWAVHPGGRSVLDAVEQALALPPEALADSREILRAYGNMSSATIMFVLKRMLERGEAGRGCALAFGPGLTSESLIFHIENQTS